MYGYTIEVAVDVCDQYVEVDMGSRNTDRSGVTVEVSGNDVTWSGVVSAEADLYDVEVEIDLSEHVDACMVFRMIEDEIIDSADLNFLADIKSFCDDEIAEELVERMINNETTFLLAKVAQTYAERKSNIAVGERVLSRAQAYADG
jgi:hypothetical protein